MRLLLDENLPQRLLSSLEPHFPGSSHVAGSGLSAASDEDVWRYAKTEGFAIVSKDADFQQLGFLRGFPPKVIWIRRGNCTTSELESLLLASVELIERFVADEDASVLMLS